MPANESTPSQGQESTDAETDWERACRLLLWREAEQVNHDLNDWLTQLAVDARDGHTITEDHAGELRQMLVEFEQVVRVVEVLAGMDPDADLEKRRQS